MTRTSKIVFSLFSGLMGVLGIAAITGVFDTPPSVTVISRQAESESKPSNDTTTEVAPLTSDAKGGSASPKPDKDPTPSFDVLRVEKDGSTLIAGQAEAGSTVEIIVNGIVVATTTAGSSGDFVAILEQVLPPGDHQISIRATGKNNNVMTSLETGLVSIPQNKEGELLAMVMKPGEASRILQKPSTAENNTTAKTETDVIVASNETKQPVADENNQQTKSTASESVAPAKVEEQPAMADNQEVAEASPKIDAAADKVTITSQTTTADAGKKTDEPVAEKSTTTESSEKKDEQAATQTANLNNTQKQAEKNVTVKDAPAKQAKKADAVEKSSVEKKEVKSATAPLVKKAEEVAKPAKTIEQPKASQVSSSKPAEKPVVVEKAPTIVVEAVEVEGSRMFVAGAAEPGRRVAIYVDNIFVGFTLGTNAGRFLLEVERGLARGSHVVRADVFDASGQAVAGRAEVPLVHEPEESPVVVAKLEKKPEEKMPEAKAVDDKKTEEKSVAKKPVTKDLPKPAEAPKKQENKTTETAKTEPAASEIKKAETKPAVKSVAETKSEKTTEPVVADAGSQPVEEAKKIEKTEKVAIKQAPAKQVTSETAAAPVVKKPVAEKIVPPATQPAIKKVEVASTATTAKPAKKIIRTGSSVIIRRGDSLWRISYRTYGKGVRYSTIYQANLKQLRSPHKIYPGQILKVPKKDFAQEG